MGGGGGIKKIRHSEKGIIMKKKRIGWVNGLVRVEGM